jgi:hypothetical protein
VGARPFARRVSPKSNWLLPWYSTFALAGTNELIRSLIAFRMLDSSFGNFFNALNQITQRIIDCDRLITVADMQRAA